MCPLISRARMSRAWTSASSGLSANLTPPAFMRPPVRTWDLITVGPPIRWAISRASPAPAVRPGGLAAGRAADPLGDVARLAGVGREPVVGGRDAGALDDLARLVL